MIIPFFFFFFLSCLFFSSMCFGSTGLVCFLANAKYSDRTARGTDQGSRGRVDGEHGGGAIVMSD